MNSELLSVVCHCHCRNPHHRVAHCGIRACPALPLCGGGQLGRQAAGLAAPACASLVTVTVTITVTVTLTVALTVTISVTVLVSLLCMTVTVTVTVGHCVMFQQVASYS